MRDEIQNFSLNYRHISDKNSNSENHKVILILHLKMAQRSGIRVLVYEKDNIKELASRLVHHLFQQH